MGALEPPLGTKLTVEAVTARLLTLTMTLLQDAYAILTTGEQAQPTHKQTTALIAPMLTLQAWTHLALPRPPLVVARVTPGTTLSVPIL